MSNIMQGAFTAVKSALTRNKKIDKSGKKSNPRNNNVKKYNFFQRIYRVLCYIGTKIQFKTYNLRRRIKKIFRPAGQKISAFWHAGIVEPLSHARDEFLQICRELRSMPADIRAKSGDGRISENMRLTAVMLRDHRKSHRSFFVSACNVLLPLICVGVLVSVAVSLSSNTYALEVSYNGKVLGYISDESVYNSAVQMLRQRMPSSSEDYKSTLTPTYSMASVNQSLQMDSEQLCEAILADSENVESAYGLYIDGELCAAIRSYGDIQFIMQTFLDKYKTGAEGETVAFVGETEIISGLFDTDKIVSSEDFARTISTERTETQIYTVKDGDTAQSIANAYNMTYNRLMELNENLSGEPAVGASVLVEKVLPVLAVETIRTETITETIKYTKKTVKDKNQYVGYSKCTTKGRNGKRRVVQQVTEVNGVQVSREVLSSEVIVQPVNAVYTVGTKKASKVGSGSFTWPVPGVRTISSPYGYRWGRMHSGIDISTTGVYGRTVVAADSGTVTVKNSASGYGLHIIISHGNGYSTCYAHLSSVSVSSGQTVAKGQAIGKVGNSGSSTGPHLHFEIRVNNSPRNPMNYF